MNRLARPSPLLGVAVAVTAVAAVTGVNYALRLVAPPVSTGVVYLLAVLLVSSYWGLWLGLLTGFLSAAAFNFFHLPPEDTSICRGRELGGAGCSWSPRWSRARSPTPARSRAA